MMKDEVVSTWGLNQLEPIEEPSADERIALGPQNEAMRTKDHAALLYWRSNELLQSVVPYLIAGLAAGDKVVYVADDLPLDRIRAELQSAGVDVDAAASSGKLVLTTAKDAFFGDGRFDVERALANVRGLAEEAKAAGFARVRFSVEMTYLLADVPGIERGIEFESRANDEVFAQYPFVCICSFNASRAVGSEIIGDVLATHPIVISGGVPLRNPHYRTWSQLKPS